jgi:hypothetical protein
MAMNGVVAIAVVAMNVQRLVMPKLALIQRLMGVKQNPAKKVVVVATVIVDQSVWQIQMAMTQLRQAKAMQQLLKVLILRQL